MSSLSFLTFPTSRTLSSDVSHSPGIEQEQTGGLSISYNGILANARWIVFGACIKIAWTSRAPSFLWEDQFAQLWKNWAPLFNSIFALKRTNKGTYQTFKVTWHRWQILPRDAVSTLCGVFNRGEGGAAEEKNLNWQNYLPKMFWNNTFLLTELFSHAKSKHFDCWTLPKENLDLPISFSIWSETSEGR